MKINEYNFKVLMHIVIHTSIMNFPAFDVINNFPLQELRTVFAAKAKQTGNEEKSISIAAAPGISNIETSYNITEIVKLVQFIISVFC